MALSVYLKKFFGEIKLLAKSSANDEVFLLAEDDGTFKSSNYGKQTGGTLGAFNLNSNNVLRIENLEGGRVQVDPVLITNSESVLWNPGSTASEIYEVMFNIVNSTGTAVTGVHIGQDIAAGGSLSAGEYFVQGLIIPGNGYSGWFGPFIIAGDDDIRGVAGTTNVLAIHWNIRRVYGV